MHKYMVNQDYAANGFGLRAGIEAELSDADAAWIERDAPGTLTAVGSGSEAVAAAKAAPGSLSSDGDETIDAEKSERVRQVTAQTGSDRIEGEGQTGPDRDPDDSQDAKPKSRKKPGPAASTGSQTGLTKQ